MHYNENAASSTSTFQQKELSDQERLPSANLAYEAPTIQNQSSELDGLLVTSQQKKFTTVKTAPSSATGLISDNEPLVVASDASTEGQVTPAARFSRITPQPSLFTSTSLLADFQSAPTTTPFLETSPSNNINKESPCFSVLGDVDEVEIEPMSSLGLKRGGRETKLPIKYQDIEWKTVQERGNHGHRGCGSKC
ncbi:hypothetical protein HID58_021234 [Brassica napus]|uniref:Uncharacterized protein n=1 Tax=Brassica napus TaxID=3708 RepID=A0ABQ8CY88_BRANA|nr:hypothetical protein HID58_021234 [Brassica napus]